MLTTVSLSPNIMVECSIGSTPRYRNVFCKSMICSVHVLAATYSEPEVAVSTVDQFGEEVNGCLVGHIEYTCDGLPAHHIIMVKICIDMGSEDDTLPE